MGPSKKLSCHFKRPIIKRIKFNFFSLVFFTDQRGRTPLHFAAQHGQLPVCELIIANVENKNPMDREGHTPLYYAAKHGQMTVCQFIIENISDKNPLNPKDDYGCTLLHWAAEHGYLEVCQLIINYIEDKNPTNSSRRTPLHYAAQNGHLSICQLIMKNLTDPNPKGNFVIFCDIIKGRATETGRRTKFRRTETPSWWTAKNDTFYQFRWHNPLITQLSSYTLLKLCITVIHK